MPDFAPTKEGVVCSQALVAIQPRIDFADGAPFEILIERDAARASLNGGALAPEGELERLEIRLLSQGIGKKCSFFPFAMVLDGEFFGGRPGSDHVLEPCGPFR